MRATRNERILRRYIILRKCVYHGNGIKWILSQCCHYRWHAIFREQYKAIDKQKPIIDRAHGLNANRELVVPSQTTSFCDTSQHSRATLPTL